MTENVHSCIDTLYTDIPFPDFPERLQNELLTVPHKTERPDDVAHAEQVNPGGPSQEDDVQGHPVHVGEEAALDHVQIGPVDTQQHNTTFIHSNKSYYNINVGTGLDLEQAFISLFLSFYIIYFVITWNMSMLLY